MNTNFSLTTDQTDEANLSLWRLVEEAYDNSTEHGFTKIYEDLMAAVPVERRRYPLNGGGRWSEPSCLPSWH